MPSRKFSRHPAAGSDHPVPQRARWFHQRIIPYQGRSGLAQGDHGVAWPGTLVTVSVDHDSPDPPYLQVAGMIRRQIEAGELRPGQRVPSVTTLMQTYGIARNTARHALEVLRDEGLITVRPGWGSFVKPE